ncbi:MAG: hypothetical protein ACRDS9_24855 [Pseudonocardiaceae bacterium]
MAIVDASVVVEFIASDADTAATVQQVFDCWGQTSEELHAPAILLLEVMNALLTGCADSGGTAKQPMRQPVWSVRVR